MPETQAGLFDPPKPQPGLGTARSDRKIEGLQAKAEKTGSRYIEIASAVIRALAIDRETFTSDDVRKLLGNPSGLDPRTLGCAFRAERIAGRICSTGEWRVSDFASRNGGVVRVWKGTKK